MNNEEKKTILVVEDESIISIIISKALNRFGYNAINVSTGEKALELVVSNENIDLILMDIDLGSGIDGTEAARRILAVRNIPIVFHSSHSEREMVERVKGITRYGYVIKSSGDFVLQSSLEMAFELFNANRNIEQSMIAMTESEEKYRLAFITSPDAVNINAMDGRYVDINEGFTKLTGYTRDDVIGVLSSEIKIWSRPEDRVTFVNGLKEKGVVENLESVFRCKDGSLKTALISGRLIKLKNELHILSITRDISDNKRAEMEIKAKNRELTVLNEELHATLEEMEATNEELLATNERLIESEREIEQSEEKFREMFFQHQAVMLLVDPDSGCIVDANSAAEAFYGYEMGLFRNMKIQDINILSQDEIAAEMHLAKVKNRNYFIFPHRLANSEIRTVEVYSSPVTINGNKLLFSIIHDISGQDWKEDTPGRHTESELNESQDRLKNIIENSSELICEIDDHGRYTFVSKRYMDVLGYSFDDLAGTMVTDIIHPEEREAAIARYEILKSETGRSVDEWRFKSKNGIYHTFECRSSVYVGKDGARMTVVISHDITESKLAEDTQLFLIVSGSPLSGGDFFQSLAKYLADTLGMDYVCIDRLSGGGLSAKTVAVYFDGDFEDNVEYTLHNTPCGDVVGKSICVFKENVSDLFPEDIVLRDMGAESYAGVTLWSSTGKPIGLIAVIGRKKMENLHLAESVLKMVAIRAAGELERRDAEERIRNLLKEKEILLQEVHHRIKNNMNTVNGLLALQADAVKDPAAVNALNNAISRVQSMMVLYDKLYRSDDFKEVSVKSYLPSLIDEIISNFPNRGIVKTDIRIEDFTLDAKMLVPLGIIINEIITNIMKYAFICRDNGLIAVTALSHKTYAELVIEDNGVGLPESINFENSTGFGMQLVGMLTEQIGGSIRIERGDGTRFVLKFDV